MECQVDREVFAKGAKPAMDNEYYRVIEGHEVWVTLHWPRVYNDATGQFFRANRCYSAFAIGTPAKWTNREPVSDGVQVRWFESADLAVQEAFLEAKRRILAE